MSVSALRAVAKGLRVAPAELLGSAQSADAGPTIGALYERAPAEARAAVTTLLRLVVRVARFASVGVDDVLTGKYPPPGTCPHCGHDSRSPTP